MRYGGFAIRKTISKLFQAMDRGKKGQVKIIEGLLTLIIVISALSFLVYFGGVQKTEGTSALEEVGENVLSVIDDQAVVEKIVFTDDAVDAELKTLIEALLPPDVYYVVTFSSAKENRLITEISNLENQTQASTMEAISFQKLRSVSMPVARKEFLELDVVLVIDRSGSMGWETPTRLSYAKQAAKTFVDQLNGSRDLAGLTSFGWDGTNDHQLSHDAASVKAAIDDLYANGATNMGEGLEKANDEFVARHREDTVAATILLSDGLVNVDRNGNYYDDNDDRTPAMDYVREEADVAEAMGVIIYTIGLGETSNNFDEDLLKEVVRNGGKYYHAPSADDLGQIYDMIAMDLFYKVQYDIVRIGLTLYKAG
jgi:Mg-chelatase subunit ChlD